MKSTVTIDIMASLARGRLSTVKLVGRRLVSTCLVSILLMRAPNRRSWVRCPL